MPSSNAAAKVDLTPTGALSGRHDAIKPLSELTFRTSGRQDLQVELSLEPIQNLRHKVAAAMRIEPTVTLVATQRAVPSRAFAKLSDEDLAIIDGAVMDLAGRLLGGSTTAAGQPPLLLPMSFRTISSRKGRQALASLGGVRADRIKNGVLVELIDVDRGTPEGRLTEVTGLLGHICKGVFVRLAPGRDPTVAVRGARLQGLTLDGADLVGDEGEIAGLLLDVAQQAKGMAPALVAQGLSSDILFAVAEVAGFTHASVRQPART